MKTLLLSGLSARLRGLLGGLLLLAAAPAYAQVPANDDPLGAIVLPVGATCAPTAGTTAGATYTASNGYLDANCGGLSGGPGGGGLTGYQPDVWYRFTTPAAGATASRAVRLTLAGTAAGLVRVFTTPVGSAGPFSEVRCASSGAANTAVGNVDLIGLQPNTIYYLLVGGYLATDTRGPFTICVSEPPPCGDPQNVGISGIGATTAQLDFRPGNGNVSYTVVVTRQGGPPVTLTPAPTATPIILTGLVASSAYTVTLQANCTNGGTSTVFTRGFSTTVSNDEPQDAIVLPLGITTCTPTSGTTVGATHTTNASPMCAFGFGSVTPYDVWYKIPSPTNGNYIQTVVTGNADLVRIFEPSGSFLLPLDCSIGLGLSGQPGQTAPPLFTFLTGGAGGGLSRPYYIAVASGSPGVPGGPFTICVTEFAAPICRAPTMAGAFITGNTTVDISFFPYPFNSPAGYTVTATPQGAGSTVVATAPAGTAGVRSVVSMVGLTPGTRYTASIVGRCSASAAAPPVTVSFITPYLPPVNDQCSGAIPIACGQTLAGSLNGATIGTTTLTTCGGVAVGYSNVYYSLTGTGTPITVSLCSPNTQVSDNILVVLQGDCNNLTCIGANTTDPTCPTRNAKLTFSSLAGQRYTVVVRSPLSGTFTGNFDLTATCAAPTCGVATGVTVNAITSVSARVDFVAPVGGLTPTNYAVTLTSASAPAVTATVVGSPCLVSGLRPNTAYTACVTTSCGAAAAPSSCSSSFSTPLSSRSAALAEQLGLFPNPAQRSTTLTVPAALLRQPGLLSLSDALGRSVQQRFVTPAPGRSADTRAELDLRGLPAGVYTLRLLSSEGPLTRRLVVE